MHLLIDFDYTLFDTEAMRKSFIVVLEPYGISEQQYRAAERELKAKGLYDIDHHIALLVVGKQREVVGKAINAVLRDTSQFLYPDALPFLKRHAFTALTVVSFGTPAWQRRKITGSGIIPLVDDVVVTDQPKSQMMERWKDEQTLVLLNDRGTEIDAMKKMRNDMVAIWVRRPEARYVNEQCQQSNYTVNNLEFDIRQLFTGK